MVCTGLNGKAGSVDELDVAKGTYAPPRHRGSSVLVESGLDALPTVLMLKGGRVRAPYDPSIAFDGSAAGLSAGGAFV